MNRMNKLLSLVATFSACIIISACGQKGPLIVDRAPEDFTRTQEGLPNEISPVDGSETDSEAAVEVRSEEDDTENSDGQ